MSANSLLVATPHIRWVHRLVPYDYGVTPHWTLILQQYWTDPLGVSGKGEWRDTPTVNETVTENRQEPPTLEN
jgi:hypothetical protein